MPKKLRWWKAMVKVIARETLKVNGIIYVVTISLAQVVVCSCL